MSNQRDVRLIVREIRNMPEFEDLSYNDVLNAVYWSQFGFVHNVISSCLKDDFDSYKSVRIPSLGTFFPHPKRVQKKVEHYNEQNKSEEECED